MDAADTTAECVEDDVWRGGPGRYGTFTFDSASPDAVSYRYGFNDDPSPANVAIPATPGGPVSVTWMPPQDGPNFVSVQSYDAEGFPSERSTCTFLVASRLQVSEWRLDEAAGATVAADARGAHPATSGAGVTFGASGPGCHGLGDGCQRDRAARLTGAADSYLSTSGGAVIDTASGFAVAAWVRLTSAVSDQVAVSQDGTDRPGFTLGYSASTGKWVFALPAGEGGTAGEWSVSSAGPAAVGEWVHLAATYDPVLGTITLFVSGRVQPVAQRGSAWTAQGAVQLGRGRTATGYSGHWVGELADVRLYDRIAFPNEITELFRREPIRLGYWQLDSVTNGDSPEYSGGESLAVAGGSMYLSDPVDPFADPALVGTGHLVLDGVDDYATTQTPIVPTDRSFTVSLTVRLAGQSCTRNMTAISQAGSVGSGFLIRCTAGNRWQVVLPHADGVDPSATVVQNNVHSPSGEMHGQHLAVTYDAALDEVRLYVDGQCSLGATGQHAATWAAGGGLQLGRALLGGVYGEYFDGVVDEVRVYAGAVDEATVGLLASRSEQPGL